MTEDQRSEEGAEEEIEDLEAPAEAQADVVGGAACGDPSVLCMNPTCVDTKALCDKPSHMVIVYDRDV